MPGAGNIALSDSQLLMGNERLRYVDVELLSTSISNIISSALPGNGSFCVLVFFAGHDSTSSTVDSGQARITTSNPDDSGEYLFFFSGLNTGIVIAKGADYRFLRGDEAANIPVVKASLFGYDASSRKVWVVKGSAVDLSSSMPAGFDVANLGAFKLSSRYIGSMSVLHMSVWAGQKANDIFAIGSGLVSAVGALAKDRAKVSASSSALYSSDGSYTGLNSVCWSSDGVCVYPMVVNLLSNSVLLSSWTAGAVSLVNLLGVGVGGVKILGRIAETATTAEHKITTTITPLATGKHWLECTVRMSTIEAIAINVNNGENLGNTSFDATGAETGYSGDGSAQIVALGSGLFRVKLPINPATLDVCTITVRGLLLVGEDYEDTYLGATSRVAYVGQWSLVRSEAPPLAVPVSLGSAATAIARSSIGQTPKP